MKMRDTLLTMILLMAAGSYLVANYAIFTNHSGKAEFVDLAKSFFSWEVLTSVIAAIIAPTAARILSQSRLIK